MQRRAVEPGLEVAAGLPVVKHRTAVARPDQSGRDHRAMAFEPGKHTGLECKALPRLGPGGGLEDQAKALGRADLVSSFHL
ncbi:hypothetical protein CEW88_19220 (plasmid) [Alloyangia pacifica]|uniref:Uncharacterized protein n=1 Tax=Alloyangia pacifica TaxID=311180 RepID=A0A2U8HK31_9RHOB|nr:hypothetical protein CEW88_19220 [Alloyangia pacifica]